ncbi:MAG: nucleoside deaminase [Bacteroidota bacterium]
MESQLHSHEHFMREAFKEAMRAFEADEVPVGAVIVCENRIIARGHNLTERLNDPTAHAEMQAFTAATNHLGGKYLDSCTLYVTLEPCVMCAGASFWTQIGAVVYGARDEKRGFIGVSGKIMHPKTAVTGGIMESECSSLLKQFFKKKRN